jgi:hypothetical protein
VDTARLKLARQALAAHKAQLATAANKDQVRRAIKAAEGRIKELEEDKVPAVGSTVRITRADAKSATGTIVAITYDSPFPYKVMGGGFLHHLGLSDFELES